MTERTCGGDQVSRPLSPRAARSREKLLRAATELLVELGPRGVTVDAVSDASGVAKSTLYRHWETRDDLLVDVVRSNIPDIAAPDASLDFEAALRSYLGRAAATVADPEWSRIVPAMMSLRTTMPDLAAMVDEDRSAKSDKLQGIIDRGIAEGSLPADIDVELVAHLLFGPIIFSALVGDSSEAGRLADFVVDRFIASYAS